MEKVVCVEGCCGKMQVEGVSQLFGDGKMGFVSTILQPILSLLIKHFDKTIGRTMSHLCFGEYAHVFIVFTSSMTNH